MQYRKLLLYSEGQSSCDGARAGCMLCVQTGLAWEWELVLVSHRCALLHWCAADTLAHVLHAAGVATHGPPAPLQAAAAAVAQVAPAAAARQSKNARRNYNTKCKRQQRQEQARQARGDS
jgi:hypothetical protein